MSYTALYLAILHLAVLISIVLLSAKVIRMRLNKTYWIALAAVLLASAYYLVSMPQYHFYYCDDWYPLKEANCLVRGNIECLNLPNFVSNGVLFVPGFILFGVSDAVAFNSAIVMGLLSLFFVFLLGYQTTGKPLVGLVSALLLSSNIIFITNSLSTYNHIPSLLFALISIYAMSVYIKKKDSYSLYLAITTFVFAVHLRMEFIVLGALIFPYYFFVNRKKILLYRTYLPLIYAFILIVLALPKYIEYIKIHVNSPLDSTMQNLINNLMHELYGFLGLNLLTAILVIIGTAYAIRHKMHYLISLIGIGILFACIYLRIETGHLSGGRHFLLTATVAYIVAGYGIYGLVSHINKKKLRLAAGILSVLILAAASYPDVVRHIDHIKNNQSTQDFIFASRLPEYIEPAIPEGCTIISPHPVRFSATTSLTASSAGSTLPAGCKIFVDDISCSYPTDYEVQMCIDFKNEHDMSLYRTIKAVDMGIDSSQAASLYMLE